MTQINGFQTCRSSRDPFLKLNLIRNPIMSMVWLELGRKAWSLSHVVFPQPWRWSRPLKTQQYNSATMGQVQVPYL